jgi:iron complex outermembrane receptor protein
MARANSSPASNPLVVEIRRMRLAARYLVPVTTLLLSVWVPGAIAQQPAAPTEETFLGDMPLVLTATRLPQPQSETPASVTVIDRQMIEASGALTIPDVLRLVPGFQVAHVDGNRASVTYHGLSDAYARRMQVLIDGRSVYVPTFGNVIWSSLPLALEDIERIEVTRGPNGVTYGANAFAAVINILTRHAAQDQGLYAKVTEGDGERRQRLLRVGTSDGPLSLRTTLGYRHDTGVDARPDNQTVNLATLRADYQASRQDSVETQLGYNGGHAGVGTYTDRSDPAREDQTTSHFESVRWRRQVNVQEEWSLHFYHNYFRSFDTYRTVPPPAPLPPITVLIDQDYRTERYNLEWQHTLAPRADTRLVWGAEARQDKVLAPMWLNQPYAQRSNLYRLFGNIEWRLAADWITNLGAMYEHNDLTGGDVSPRLGLNWHVVPDHTLRASASRGYRTPSLFEAYSDALIRYDNGTAADLAYRSTETLKPERITAYEAGYFANLRHWHATLDLKWFREEIEQAIVQARDTTGTILPGDTAVFTFRNDGASTAQGVEAQLALRPFSTTRLVYAGAYANQNGQMLKRINTGGTVYTDTDLSTPEWTQSYLLIQQLPAGLELSGAYYRMTSIRWLDGGDDDDTGTIKTYDARLAYRLRAGRTRGEVAVVGQNLRLPYYDYANQIVLSKRWFCNVSLEFH